MFKKIESIVAVVSVILGIYIILSNSFKYTPFMQLLISSVLIIRGIRELKEKGKKRGIVDIAMGIALIIFAIILLNNPMK